MNIESAAAVLLLAVTAASAQPYHESPGMREAFAACETISFSSDKADCVKSIRDAFYYDVAAVNACASISFASDRIACLRGIGNKIYDPAEVRACASIAFASDRTDCLANAGRPVHGSRHPRYEPRPEVDSYILDQLRMVRRELERGNLPRAIAGIASLTDFLEQGSR